MKGEERKGKGRSEARGQLAKKLVHVGMFRITCRVWHEHVCRYATVGSFGSFGSAWHITFDFLALKCIHSPCPSCCHSSSKYHYPFGAFEHYASLLVCQVANFLGKANKMHQQKKEQREKANRQRYKQFKFHCIS